MSDVSTLCVVMLYGRILSAPPLPPLLLSKCCSCCETMHPVHFQRLSTERVSVLACSQTGRVCVRCTMFLVRTGVNNLCTFYPPLLFTPLLVIVYGFVHYRQETMDG